MIPDAMTRAALEELLALAIQAPTVTWTKPDGQQNTYLALHQTGWERWCQRWGTP